jgi:hypothetical protein
MTQPVRPENLVASLLVAREDGSAAPHQVKEREAKGPGFVVALLHSRDSDSGAPSRPTSATGLLSIRARAETEPETTVVLVHSKGAHAWAETFAPCGLGCVELAGGWVFV